MRERRGPAYHVSAPPIAPTARQLEVARYLSHGLTEAMAADALFLSHEAVKDRTRGLRTSLAAKNTMHAVCECIRRGLID